MNSPGVCGSGDRGALTVWPSISIWATNVLSGRGRAMAQSVKGVPSRLTSRSRTGMGASAGGLSGPGATWTGTSVWPVAGLTTSRRKGMTGRTWKPAVCCSNRRWVLKTAV